MKKANCDVDLTFYAMRDIEKYQKAIFFTGDGDFEILLKHLLQQKIEVRVVANGKRTAREIKNLMGGNFTPMKSLKSVVEYVRKNKKG